MSKGEMEEEFNPRELELIAVIGQLISIALKPYITNKDKETVEHIEARIVEFTAG